MRLVRLILILSKEFIIGRHLSKWSITPVLRLKRASLTVGNYEARFSTRKINDKIQNAKTSSKLNAGEKIYATSKMADSTTNWNPVFSVDHVTKT